MDIQNSILKEIGSDKILHFFAGGWISAVVYPKWWVAIPVAVIVGLLKEIIDFAIRKTGFDWRDWFATALGGVVTAVFLYFYSIIW